MIGSLDHSTTLSTAFLKLLFGDNDCSSFLLQDVSKEPNVIKLNQCQEVSSFFKKCDDIFSSSKKKINNFSYSSFKTGYFSNADKSSINFCKIFAQTNLYEITLFDFQI